MPQPPLDIDPDWLRERLKMPRATAREIAAEIGHHPSTVSSHARRLGIRLRAPWPDRSEFDEAWLRRRYVDDRAKIGDIAAEAGVSYDVVQRAIGRFGLTGQGRGIGRPPDIATERASCSSSSGVGSSVTLSMMTKGCHGRR